MAYKQGEIRRVLKQERSRGRKYPAADPDIVAANRNREQIIGLLLTETETEEE